MTKMFDYVKDEFQDIVNEITDYKLDKASWEQFCSFCDESMWDGFNNDGSEKILETSTLIRISLHTYR